MKNLIFSIDVGGTFIKLAIITNKGEMVNKWKIPTNTAEKGSLLLLKFLRVSKHSENN